MTQLARILLLAYYLGGTLALWIGAYMVGGGGGLLMAVGAWAIFSAVHDRDMRH